MIPCTPVVAIMGGLLGMALAEQHALQDDWNRLRGKRRR